MPSKKTRFELLTAVRRASAALHGARGMRTFLALGPTEPLLLAPEPDNPVHRTAVRVHVLTGEPCGYLAAEDAAPVFERLTRGELLLAACRGPRTPRLQPVRVWSEGENSLTRALAAARLVR